MTIEHNVIDVNGVLYKAVKSQKDLGCGGCALYAEKTCRSAIAPCTPGARHDDEFVIYKRHYRPASEELKK